jgi:hypothetical protein
LGRGGPPRPWLAGHQAEFPHDVADQLGTAVLPELSQSKHLIL